MSKLSPENRLKKLRRLESNMTCPNCGTVAPMGLGFGHVCVKFNTFICDSCKTSHQAISHRVKSITMSNWTHEEVDALTDEHQGGNNAARHIWLGNAPPCGSRYPGGARPKPGDRIDIFKQFVLDCYEYGKFRANEPYQARSSAIAQPDLVSRSQSAPTPMSHAPPAAAFPVSSALVDIFDIADSSNPVVHEPDNGGLNPIAVGANLIDPFAVDASSSILPTPPPNPHILPSQIQQPTTVTHHQVDSFGLNTVDPFADPFANPSSNVFPSDPFAGNSPIPQHKPSSEPAVDPFNVSGVNAGTGGSFNGTTTPIDPFGDSPSFVVNSSASNAPSSMNPGMSMNYGIGINTEMNSAMGINTGMTSGMTMNQGMGTNLGMGINNGMFSGMTMNQGMGTNLAMNSGMPMQPVMGMSTGMCYQGGYQSGIQAQQQPLTMSVPHKRDSISDAFQNLSPGHPGNQNGVASNKGSFQHNSFDFLQNTMKQELTSSDSINFRSNNSNQNNGSNVRNGMTLSMMQQQQQQQQQYHSNNYYNSY